MIYRGLRGMRSKIARCLFYLYFRFVKINVQDEYAEQLAGQNIPSEEDFQDADLNEDGTLMLEEWLEWVMEDEESDEEEESTE